MVFIGLWVDTAGLILMMGWSYGLVDTLAGSDGLVGGFLSSQLLEGDTPIS
jgi:hypothetical protein